MKHHAVLSPEAPEPIGPYSQAVQAGDLLFCSGQIPLDPVTGEMPGGIAAQTRQVLDNLAAVLRTGGSGLDRVVKTTVYLASLDDFPRMNAVYAEVFSDAVAPARSTVEVAALPKGALVEIDAVALASG